VSVTTYVAGVIPPAVCFFLPTFLLFFMIRATLLVLLLLVAEPAQPQTGTLASAVRVGRVKYFGGGDWYNDPSAEVNLLTFVRQTMGIDVDPTYIPVDISSEQIFSFPVLFMTGHGNIAMSEKDIANLRTYLQNGGFLYVDDDYGMDRSFRREMKRVFPEKDLVELPFSFGLYHTPFSFAQGPPKTHKHDEKPPQGFGLFHNGRLVVYYTFESNPSDGWADPEVHGDPPEKRTEALRFGANIIMWALTH
jgi:hypothetical protein